MSIADTGRPSSGTLDHEHLAAVFLAARDGDRSAFDELIGILTPVLWQVARAQGLDRDSSADVVQTVWLTLLGSLAEVCSPGALTAWLVTVTKREAWRVRTEHRAHRRLDESELRQEPDPGPGPEQRALTEESQVLLWAAVSRLSEKCQSLLRIVAFVHRPHYDQVSAALGMKRGSIGPTRSRCLTELRRLLTTDQGGVP
ncbi:RNA polymerase sigma factor [Amycolatopsis alba]|uniref:Sigma-70 family RNA polymerase sigma factor n=1 Tax=Amycolatopsis alba DSM 44262 TaxID=1125972 RepID=A0A229S2U0_AMYAL|nr:sigma-70 family RNA polymerase sigma factor [Amycolatopsis alba]OXM53105.1 sigma-70 family RNA polymerase sigma factor [Amycolatopsis alba DSM 44262]